MTDIASKVATFKARWAEADTKGMEGHRVEYAIAPLLGDAWEEGRQQGSGLTGGYPEDNPYKAECSMTACPECGTKIGHDGGCWAVDAGGEVSGTVEGGDR